MIHLFNSSKICCEGSSLYDYSFDKVSLKLKLFFAVNRGRYGPKRYCRRFDHISCVTSPIYVGIHTSLRMTRDSPYLSTPYLRQPITYVTVLRLQQYYTRWLICIWWHTGFNFNAYKWVLHSQYVFQSSHLHPPHPSRFQIVSWPVCCIIHLIRRYSLHQNSFLLSESLFAVVAIHISWVWMWFLRVDRWRRWRRGCEQISSNISIIWIIKADWSLPQWIFFLISNNIHLPMRLSSDSSRILVRVLLFDICHRFQYIYVILVWKWWIVEW